MALNMLRGTGEAYFIPSISNAEHGGGPTEAELDAGIKLGAGFNAINGLARQRNPIQVPVMRHRTELQIAGPEQFQAISLTIVEEDGTSTEGEALERMAILETMVEGATGWLVLFRYTQDPVVGDTAHFIQITVDDQEPNWDLGATAETTDLNLTPATPLFKGELQAA